METVISPRLITATDYEQLEEVLGFRDELIEGERVLSPNAIFPHAAIIKRLESILESQLAELSAEPLQVARETGWRIYDTSSGVDSVPSPDLMVIREEDAQHAIKSRRWFEGLPLVVIEVISPSERRARRLQKIGLYLDIGVSYVVEVDYTKRVISVYSAEAESVAVYREGDQMTVPFRVVPSEIFTVLD